jgi:hypothetical protein
MNVYPLQLEQSGHFTHKVVLTHADLTETAANTAQVIEMITVAAGDIVTDAAFIMTTSFTDASDAAFNTVAVTVGDGGSATRYLSSTETNSNGTEVFYKAGTLTAGNMYTVADTVDITFNSMALKSLVDIDAGSLTILLKVVRAASI